LCSGIPAFVTRSAGVAERYPPHLAGLLLDDPNDVAGLIKRLEDWRSRKEEYRTATRALAEQLRAITWDDMAGQVVRLVEASA
jgi:glycosyltransferase involved in cell wall biosynthesis